MRKALSIVVLVIGVGLAGWLLWPSPPKDDEALIRQMVAEIARSASEKDIAGVCERVSERYQGEGGGKQELKGYLFAYTRRSDWVTAVPMKVEVTELEETRAKLSMVVLLARKPADSAEELQANDIAGSHQIEAELAKEDGEWRVVTARRRDANATDLL